MSLVTEKDNEERYVEKDESNVTNVFRDVEKFYRLPGVIKKKKTKVTDFTNVIDFSNIEANTEENKKLIIPIDLNKFTDPEARNAIKGSPIIQKAYALANVEGFYFIPNPFTEEEQKYWVKRNVIDFPIGNPTNVTNLHKTEPWTEWKEENMIPLRWATLGYHFQWTPRKYMEEFRGEFPSDLSTLCSGIARQLGWNMTPEAATINFYPVAKQLMGGHLDDAEEDMSKPIVSCSFGNTVVFLIGGRTRDVSPTALYIRSGDVVLMGGHSRFCYHGVPRMLENTCPSFLYDGDDSNAANYIKNSRINMNVRQVRVHTAS